MEWAIVLNMKKTDIPTIRMTFQSPNPDNLTFSKSQKREPCVMSMANIFIQMIQRKKKDHKWQRGPHICLLFEGNLDMGCCCSFKKLKIESTV